MWTPDIKFNQNSFSNLEATHVEEQIDIETEIFLSFCVNFTLMSTSMNSFGLSVNV